MPRVLIADKMDKIAAEIFAANGIDVDNKPGLTPDELSAIIGDYDGVAVRSTTKITAPIIAAAKNLRVIGRAGIGVDTVDVTAATQHGIIVMNTPFGNSVTTAEHTTAMMLALARQIPMANASTHAGKWEKSKFMGVELAGKTLGIIGCGNIGGIVASRAIGLQMKILAYDPFLTPARAADMGVTPATLDDIYAGSDFITVHTPMTDQTRGMINADAMAKMKKGVRLINCARGGLIVENDLKTALDSGHVAGAALDVFETEPATSNILFGLDNVICTPHLGASTSEAQVNVARQIAEQISAYLNTGAVANAVNMPSISADEAPRLKPYMALATQLGAFVGQVTNGGFTDVTIEYQGRAATMNTRALTTCVLAALLKPMSATVNMVNAPDIAKASGIAIHESKTDTCDAFNTAIQVTVKGKDVTCTIMGTLFAGREPRVVDIDGVPIEGAITPHMLFIRNHDKPGMIGAVGTLLASAGHNIADFRLGRVAPGAQAIALISLDAKLPDDVFTRVQQVDQIHHVTRLQF